MTTTLEAPREGEPTAYPPVETQPETQPETQAVARGALPVGRARTIALLSLFLASTMELLDTTIVNVALPTIESGLGASAAQLQWMVAAYPLAFAVGLITGSRLGDLWGRKRVFLGGLVGFTLMSAACGFAPNAEALVGFRALQGIAAAAMIPQVLSSLQVMYAPHERAKAMGLFTGLAGLSAVLGPVIGARPHRGRPRRARLALDLPRQRAVRRAGDRRRAALGAGIRCHATPAHRPARRHGARRRSARRALPAHHGTRAGLAGLGVCRDGCRCRRARVLRPVAGPRRAGRS